MRNCALVVISASSSRQLDGRSAVAVGDPFTLATAAKHISRSSRCSVLAPWGEWVFTVGPNPQITAESRNELGEHLGDRLKAA